MSKRILADNSLLRLRGAIIPWGEGLARGDTSHTLPLHLRWILNPAVGLPLEPFQVWRMSHPGGSPAKQDLVDLDWDPIETVGLPAAGHWAESPYSKRPQGLYQQEVAPEDAALQRLLRGAPTVGWWDVGPNGLQVPEWERPNEETYRDLIRDGDLMRGLCEMLQQVPQPQFQQAFEVDLQSPQDQLLPHLMLEDVIGTLSGDDKPTGSWSPLNMLALAAGTDPLAALALGFGTALDPQNFGEELYMVTVLHTIDPKRGQQIELADIVFPQHLVQPVPDPTGLATNLSHVTRPQRTDGPDLKTIAITWDRVVQQGPPASLQAEQPVPVSYGIARISHYEILLTRRAAGAPNGRDPGGWLSYVPSRSSIDEPNAFYHHVSSTFTDPGSGVVYPSPIGYEATYAVAAQDLFGRWSGWQEVRFTGPDEGPQGPTVLGVSVDTDGSVSVDFSWDWSDRSPHFVELQGAWSDDPGTVIAQGRIDFSGSASPATTTNGTITPLTINRTPCDWGAGQDKDAFPNVGDPQFHWSGEVGAEPGTRNYRWTAGITIDFKGSPSRRLSVSGRGQQLLHYIFIPGGPYNISPFGPPAMTTVWDSRPLPSPAIELDVLCWASLPDPMGISRFTLNWNAVPGAKGYLIYEVTETAVLGAAGKPPPDTSVTYATRLTSLWQSLTISAQRGSFRRLTADPLPGTSFEVTLPRGTRIMHFYAVTSLTENNMEGPFPGENHGFLAVAVPRIAPAPLVALSAGLSPDDPSHVALQLELVGGKTGRVDLYRTTNENAAVDANSMGPPIASTMVTGSTTYVDTTVSPSWLPYRYRAVAWSTRDDTLGLIESRSAPSPQVSVLLPPPAGPVIANLRANVPPGPPNVRGVLTWEVASLAPPLSAGARAIIEVYTTDPTLVLFETIAGPLIDERATVAATTAAAAPPQRIIISKGGFCQTWFNRPPVPQGLQINVKVIDPFGRSAAGVVFVPPSGPPFP